VTVAHYLGLTPKWIDGTAVGGCSFIIHVRHAPAAIASGLLCGGIRGVLWTIEGERGGVAASRGLSDEFIALLREHGERGTNPMLQRVIRGWTPAGGCAKSIASGASKTPITAQGRKNQMLVVCSTADDFVRSAI
jgi:hypothetical protein